LQLINHKNLEESQGNLMMAYAIAGGHKTCTIIQTAQDPIVLLTAEGRKIKTSIVAINRPDLRMKVGVYEGFDDLIDTIYTPSRFEGAKTVFLDSITHLMLVHLSQEILSENWASKSDKEKDEIEKQLTMQVKLSEESYGTLAQQMNRLMRGLQGLTMAGYDVVVSARLSDRPKWNRALSAAPALMGKEFSKSMDGFFDFIGYIEPWEAPVLAEGEKPPTIGASTADTWKYFAPLVSWNPNEEYMAKWTGVMPPKGIIKRKFHVQKTFQEANGIFR
jgi:hypothetical protein